MASMCADQHRFNYHNKAAESPPRKLLVRRSISPENGDLYSVDSPKADFGLFNKFLPRNSAADDDDSDPYSSDHFRIYEFKVRRCTRSRSHDWTDCPFAHPGEKARRRDPRRYHYSGAVCPDYRRGNCSRGDNCEFAHGVFEHWLHPARYRTEACKDGKNCQRKICFFAHTSRQLRVLPPTYENGMSPGNSPVSRERKSCCVHCQHNSYVGSPTSPLSPVKSRSFTGISSPISRFSDGLVHQVASGALSYGDAVTELMNSLEAINFNEGIKTLNQSFGEDQFVLSPSPVTCDFSNGGISRRSTASTSDLSNVGISRRITADEDLLVNADLGWVNDLLT